jgi:hypothetical protein
VQVDELGELLSNVSYTFGPPVMGHIRFPNTPLQ